MKEKYIYCYTWVECTGYSCLFLILEKQNMKIKFIRNNVIKELEVQEYINNTSEICFYNNIISKQKIKIIEFSIEVFFENKVINKGKYNYITYGNIKGVIAGEEVSSIYYFDVEKFNVLPYDYIKLIHLSEKFNIDVISITHSLHRKKEDIMLYYDLNEIMKENSFIKCKRKVNNLIIKTYDYVYNLKYNIQGMNRTTEDIKFCDSLVDLTVSKLYFKYFVDVSNKKFIIISFNL